MVKDFDASGFSVDYSFMTNADVPYIAAEDIITSPVNPYTSAPLTTENKNGVLDIPYMAIAPGTKLTNTFPMNGAVILHVHDSIYDPQNWSLSVGRD